MLAMGHKKSLHIRNRMKGKSLRAAGFWLDKFCNVTRDADGHVDGVVRWEFIVGHRLSEQGREQK